MTLNRSLEQIATSGVLEKRLHQAVVLIDRPKSNYSPSKETRHLLRLAKLGKKESQETRENKKLGQARRRWSKAPWKEFFTENSLVFSDDPLENKKTFYLFKLGPSFDAIGLSLDELKRAYLKHKKRTEKPLHIKQKEAVAGRQRPDACEVCGRKNKRGVKIAFDHCHKGGHFRGWLCELCNRALGQLNDDPVIVKALLDYLLRDVALTEEERLARTPPPKYAEAWFSRDKERRTKN